MTNISHPQDHHLPPFPLNQPNTRRWRPIPYSPIPTVRHYPLPPESRLCELSGARAACPEIQVRREPATGEARCAWDEELGFTLAVQDIKASWSKGGSQPTNQDTRRDYHAIAARLCSCRVRRRAR
ncbi:hypothetical protein OE88DRAFT_1665935 [Heliocybe sulcata]|uniref:Uncharacterized protein n=1 Tax=Heliocybe sulcata TaxID=5364 RepID=A0A5C3MRZ9_9AGAM|nr:hypothetical protein OE88DRAFT_1665935 [Heliocybe sulcata]